MTHFHYSTLGHCLISLARQGIKSPLHRVLRLIQAGAIVPNSPSLSLPNSQKGITYNSEVTQDKIKKKGAAKTPLPIHSGIVKVSFARAQSYFDQINSIIIPSQLQADLEEKQEKKQLQLIQSNSTQEVKKKLAQLQEFSLPPLPSIMSDDITATLQRLSASLTEQAERFRFFDEDSQVVADQDYQNTYVFFEPPKRNVSSNHNTEQINLVELGHAQHYQSMAGDPFDTSIGHITLKCAEDLCMFNFKN